MTTLHTNLPLDPRASETIVHPVKLIDIRSSGPTRLEEQPGDKAEMIRYPVIRISGQEERDSKTIHDELREERIRQEEWRRSRGESEMDIDGSQRFEDTAKGGLAFPAKLGDLNMENMKKMVNDVRELAMEKGGYLKKTVEQLMETQKFKDRKEEGRKHAWAVMLVFLAICILLFI